MLRVEVTTHFNEDPFSHGFVQGIADRLRAAGGELRCPVHGGDPAVWVSTDGVAETINQIHIDVSGCCDEIVARVARLLDEVRAQVDCDP